MTTQKFNCDICQNEYGKREDVQGTITLDGFNGDRGMWSDVCELCTKKVGEKILELTKVEK